MAKMPERPARPSSAEPGAGARKSSWLTVMLALFMALAGITSLMVMPLVGYAPVIILAVFGFAALHYVVWGWWLPKYLRDSEEEEK